MSDAEIMKLAKEATRGASKMRRRDLEASYVSAIVNWYLVIEERDKAKRALAKTTRGAKR